MRGLLSPMPTDNSLYTARIWSRTEAIRGLESDTSDTLPAPILVTKFQHQYKHKQPIKSSNILHRVLLRRGHSLAREIRSY